MMLVRELCRFQAHLAPNSLTGPLLLVTFCAGVLDTTTYFNFGTFASNQTGCVHRALYLRADGIQEYPHSYIGTTWFTPRQSGYRIDRRLSTRLSGICIRLCESILDTRTAQSQTWMDTLCACRTKHATHHSCRFFVKSCDSLAWPMGLDTHSAIGG
jgi:hypothetical protein